MQYEQIPKNDTDSVPPYEELDMDPRPPQNPISGYSSVPQNDTIPDEEQAQGHHHAYLNECQSSSRRGCRSLNPLPPPSTFQPHVHCESCDKFIARQHKMRYQRFCCAMVSLTIIMAMVCGLLLGVAIANAKGDA
ncbi:hypothetical protein ASPVEDRAFT_148725 [Aspergillus versicolor CBS 583.65]|uniref:LITAF domain-containing protein n=1 Tax=Aspergillus versicolor CBS 583.65 TaxID=1036611 RepID=A0A1L9PDY1_ASPVE|nr:uncharacterized protein ASPVEDRAFT_148725 [Aspergillus versicolor CBS 583.65]OJI99709.1 hypothetical protein ASPVEDRAFT_148725 [Aspergillus versicolor CBS 583.65]